MKISLNPGERVLREGAANLFRGYEAVGGRLFLTTARLHFQSHDFNVQTGALTLPLAAICAARPAWTQLLGVPLVPNGLWVETRSGEVYRFVVFARKAWAAQIMQQLGTGMSAQ